MIERWLHSVQIHYNIKPGKSVSRKLQTTSSGHMYVGHSHENWHIAEKSVFVHESHGSVFLCWDYISIYVNEWVISCYRTREKSSLAPEAVGILHSAPWNQGAEDSGSREVLAIIIQKLKVAPTLV